MVFLWFAFLVVMAVLFEKRTHWLSRFSIFTPLLGAMFVRYGIAVPFNDSVNDFLTGITISHEALVNYYAALVLAYLGIYFGVVFVAPNRRPPGVGELPSETVHAGPLGSVALAALVALCVAIYLTDVSLLTAMWTFGLLSGLGVYWLIRLLPTERLSRAPGTFLRRPERLKVTA